MSIFADFQVASPTVLLVKYQQGKAIHWRNLEGIWDYALTEASLGQFIRQETRAFLKDSRFAAGKP